MKIALNITVEVDPEDWASEFDVAPKDIPDDVREYFRSEIQAQFERLGHGSVVWPGRAKAANE